MTQRTGLSVTLRQRAHRAGFDINNPAVPTNPGNPQIYAILDGRTAKQAESLLERSRSSWSRMKSRLPFFASCFLATTALAWPMPIARAADSPDDPRYHYPTFAEILERVDWLATSPI